MLGLIDETMSNTDPVISTKPPTLQPLEKHLFWYSTFDNIDHVYVSQ